MRLGILGAGSIAEVVVEASLAGFLPGIELVGIAARDSSSPAATILAKRARTEALTVEELLSRSPQLVLEAASAQAVRQYALRIVSRGIRLIAVSSGGLLHPDLWEHVRSQNMLGDRIIVPSGGIAGLDGIAALGSTGGLERVELTTTKHPISLRGAPYVLDNEIDLPDHQMCTIFEGNVHEAVNGFPANINIAATVSFVGVGPERTTVRIVSDPATTTFRHRIEAHGVAGTIRVEVDSLPNPANPRSSYLAALSAVAAVRKVV